MSYFILTLIEATARGNRKAAAQRLRIEFKVLATIGELSTERGDPGTARKVGNSGTFQPLTGAEKAWLEHTVPRVVRRLGEHVAGGDLKTIGMADLPKFRLRRVPHSSHPGSAPPSWLILTATPPYPRSEQIVRHFQTTDMTTEDDGEFPVGSTESSASALIAQWRELRARHSTVALTGVSAVGFRRKRRCDAATERVDDHGAGTNGTVSAPSATIISEPPEVVIGMALVDVAERTDEGLIIAAVTPAWRGILRELESDSNALYRLDWRQMEELVAGAYKEDGWSVTLTPRSGDKGRDVIARRDDFGAIKLLDQVKAHRPGHIVDANEVRALYGVLNLDQKASKAVITTTTQFAPGVYEEFVNVIPTRLDLRDGAALHGWIKNISCDTSKRS